MIAFLLQSTLLVLAAYFAGCFIGCLARRTFAPGAQPVRARPAASATVAAAAGVPTGEVAMTRFERALTGAPSPAPAAPAPVAPAAPQAAPQTPIIPVARPAAPTPAPVPVAAPATAAPAAAAQIPAAAAAAAAAVAAVAARAAQHGNSVLPAAMGSSGPATVTANVTPAPARAPPAAVAPPAAPAPVPAAVAPSPAARPAAPADVPPPVASGMHDLTRIRAIDESMQSSLKGLGVSSYADIAAWKPADVSRISGALKIPGRIEQENWIEQAQILAKGGETYYSRRKGKGELTSARPTPDEGERITIRVPAATRTADAPAAAAPAAVAPTTGPAATPIGASAPAVDLKAAAATAAAAVQAAQAAVGPKAVAAVATAAAAATAVAAAPVTAVPVAQAPAAAPAPVPAAAPAAPASTSASGSGAVGTSRDSLQRIAGINAEVERLLNVQGVTRYSQIAGWSPSDVSRFDRLLGFEGRIARENWIEQANILARGGETAYARDLARKAAEPARPAKLADAIQAIVPASAAAAAAASAAVTAAAAVTTTSDTGPKSELANLRSVRSEAYRGPDALPGGRGSDDLKRIRGVGVLIEKKLNALGVTRYDQVSNWTQADIERFSDKLDFKGRIERENWVEQARILSAGGQTEFSQRVDRGDVESSRS